MIMKIEMLGEVTVGASLVRAADKIKLQHYKVNTPKKFQVWPFPSRTPLYEGEILMWELANMAHQDPHNLDYVFFSVCSGAEEHTDALDPAKFEPITLMVPIILPPGRNIITAEDEWVQVRLNHVYKFDHTKPHSMRLQNTTSGCVVVMVAVKRPFTVQKEGWGTGWKAGPVTKIKPE
jgi:hypothetical protein